MYNETKATESNLVDMAEYKQAREHGDQSVWVPMDAVSSDTIGTVRTNGKGRDMANRDDFVTRGEFENFTNRTDAKIDALQKEMNAGFLHITERMDDGFLKISQRLDDKFDEIKKDSAQQKKDSARFFWTLFGTLLGSIAGVVTLVLTVLNGGG